MRSATPPELTLSQRAGGTHSTSRLLPFLAVALAGFFALLQLSQWPARLRYPGEEDFIEGSPLAEMIHLHNGVPIYSPASPQRYDTANYGPLYYLLGARLVDPAKPAYGPLRLLSVLGLLGCAAGCALLAFWAARSYLAAGLAPMIFLACSFCTRHGVSARPDTGALFLVFAGFLIAYRFQSGRKLLLSAPLMILGFFYKQQFVAAPLAVFLFVILGKRYRLAAEFAGLMILGVSSLLAVFQFIAFRGQDVLLHFVFYNLLAFQGENLTRGLVYFAVFLFIPLLGALGFLGAHQNSDLLRCYVGCAVVLVPFTYGRAGSDTYYLFECLAILAPLFAAQIATRLRQASKPVLWVALPGLALLPNWWLTGRPPQPADILQDNSVQTFLRSNFRQGTPSLSYYIGDLVRAGLETPYTNLWHYNQLVRHGTLPAMNLVSQIRNRRFGLVLLDFDLENEKDSSMVDYYLNEPMRKAILKQYHLSRVLDLPRPERVGKRAKLYVWVPGRGQDESQSSLKGNSIDPPGTRR